MRIALISDLHATDVALRAVLDDIARVGVDQIVCLGDVATLGPSPNLVLQMLRDLGCPCITGNHDAFLLDPELIRAYTEAPVVVESVDWGRAQLTSEELAFVGTFQPRLEIQLDQRNTLLLFHGSPDCHTQDLLATTPADELEQYLNGYRATVMAGGHTHVQMLRQHRGILLVNPGSVGMPFKEYVGGRAPKLLDHAEYATVEAVNGSVGVTLRRVQLDKRALRNAIEATDNPMRAPLLAEYA